MQQRFHVERSVLIGKRSFSRGDFIMIEDAVLAIELVQSKSIRLATAAEIAEIASGKRRCIPAFGLTMQDTGVSS